MNCKYECQFNSQNNNGRRLPRYEIIKLHISLFVVAHAARDSYAVKGNIAARTINVTMVICKHGKCTPISPGSVRSSQSRNESKLLTSWQWKKLRVSLGVPVQAGQWYEAHLGKKSFINSRRNYFAGECVRACVLACDFFPAVRQTSAIQYSIPQFDILYVNRAAGF